jgi:glutamine amidotransferase
MNKTVTILDYGSSNLRSVAKAIETVGFTVKIVRTRAEIAAADVLVLPGQGAFQQAMAELQDLDVIDVIRAHIKNGKPYLGICLGFQILFESSSENGDHAGLGVFKGKVQHFDEVWSPEVKAKGLKVPHMGWNQLQMKRDPIGVFVDVEMPISTYFVHSYAVFDTDDQVVSTTTEYGVPFVSSIQTSSLFASQFHPEKSGALGLKILSSALHQF